MDIVIVVGFRFGLRAGKGWGCYIHAHLWSELISQYSWKQCIVLLRRTRYRMFNGVQSSTQVNLYVTWLTNYIVTTTWLALLVHICNEQLSQLAKKTLISLVGYMVLYTHWTENLIKSKCDATYIPVSLLDSSMVLLFLFNVHILNVLKTAFRFIFESYIETEGLNVPFFLTIRTSWRSRKRRKWYPLWFVTIVFQYVNSLQTTYAHCKRIYLTLLYALISFTTTLIINIENVKSKDIKAINTTIWNVSRKLVRAVVKNLAYIDSWCVT